MDFKTYAISQKIRRNSDLIKYIDTETIPVSVVEKEFKDIFEKYEDNEAELLSSDYKSFLTTCVPVSFTPTDSGLSVDGKIEDTVLEVIEDVHKVKKEDAINELVSSVVKTVNPTREFMVKDISFSEKLERINYQLLKQKEEVVSINKDTEKTKLLLDQTVIDKAVTEDEKIEQSIKHVFEQPIENVVKEIQEEPVEDVLIENNKDNVKPLIQDNELMKNVYNNFIKDTLKRKIDERVSLDNNFSFAK